MLMVKGIKKEKLYGKRINSQNKKGKYIKSKFSNSSFNDLAIDATIRAAALRNRSKNEATFKPNSYDKVINSNDRSFNIKKEDLREKVRKHGIKAAITLVIDMSGSMLSNEKLNKIKAILQKIIANVHVNRDKLAVVGFKGKDSEIIIPNTKRPNSFLNKLQTITVGGTTPMAAGLEKALEISKKESKKEEYIPMMLVLSDGVTNVGLDKSNQSNYNKNIKKNIEKNKKEINKLTKEKNSKKLISNPINDVLAIGEEIAKNGIHTVIINFEKEKNKGRSVNKELAFITNGKFYDLEMINESINDLSSNNESNDNSLVFDSFKSDLSELAIDEILNYERDNI